MKFSVLLPTRNRLELLTRAIETVRRQDYDNWEIVISDNFSEEDIAGYVRSLNEPRISYFRTESFIPVTDNWNNALNNSSGDYVVMLGDDDGLMKGYFTTLKEAIERFDAPDVIYTSAFLYAYPNVLPNLQKGFLKSYTVRAIFEGKQEPFWLAPSRAKNFARESLNFRVTFDYNMQFTLVSRKFINATRSYGPFYQSPYPDYYATNLIMLRAERILVMPKPLVTIGISPKSFGFYYFNDAENSGNEFLKNLPEKIIADRLQKIVLPGTAMNTSWLMAMETLAVNLKKDVLLKVNYPRYRFLQILAVYERLLTGKEVAKTFAQLKLNMRPFEKKFYGSLFSLLWILPLRYRPIVFGRIHRYMGAHPLVAMPEIAGQFETILDVFEQIDPHTPQCWVSEPMNTICVVHLVRAANGLKPLQQFLESYHACPAGKNHDLLIVFKGFEPTEDMTEYQQLLATTKYKSMMVSDEGFDITAYMLAVKQYAHEYHYFCFLNSHSIILNADWLKKLYDNIIKPEVGLVGATGSWLSPCNEMRLWFQNWLKSYCVWRFKKLINMQQNSSEQGDPGCHVSFMAKLEWLFSKLKFMWLFPAFPNYHIRTNVFMISTKLIQRIRCKNMATKFDAYLFESGKQGLTRQILKMGKRILIVGKDGIAYEKKDWDHSRIFWQDNQENLLVADNQTKDYQDGDSERRAYLALKAWHKSNG